jgi:hypothetical protein
MVVSLGSERAPAITPTFQNGSSPNWGLQTHTFHYNGTSSSALLTFFSYFSGVIRTGCVPCGDALVLAKPSLTDVTPVIAPTLRVQKALGTGGRVNTADQFTVQIVQDSATVVNPTTNSTTTGTGATVNPGSGTTGTTSLVAGTQYTITEAPSGGTNLSQYNSTLTCTDAAGANKALALNVAFSLQANEVINCTLTNTPKPAVAAATLQIRQSVLSPVPPNLLPPFTFQYTGNNGWSAPAISNTALNQAQTSAPIALTATGVATTVSTQLPNSRWFVAAFTCSDLSAPSSGNPTGTLVKSTTPSVTIPAAFVRPGATLRCALALGHATP